MKKCIIFLLAVCLLLGGCSAVTPAASKVAKPPASEPQAEYYAPYYPDPSLSRLQAEVTYRSDAYATLGRLNNRYGGWAQGLYETVTASDLALCSLSAPNLQWIRMAFSLGEGQPTEVFTLYENNLMVVEHPSVGKQSCTVPAGTYTAVLTYLDAVRQEQSRYFTLSPQYNDDDGYHPACYTLYNKKGKAVVSKQTAAVTPTVELVGEGLVRVTDPDGTRLYEPYTGRKSVLSAGPTDLWGDRWAVCDGQGVYVYTLFGTTPLCRVYVTATADNPSPVQSLTFSDDGASLHVVVRNAAGSLYDRTLTVQEEIDGGVLRILGDWRQQLTAATEMEEQTFAYNVLKKLRHKEQELGFLLSGSLLGHLQVGQTDYLLCELGHWVTAEDGSVSHYETAGHLMVPSGQYAGYVAVLTDNELSWDTNDDWFKK